MVKNHKWPIICVMQIWKQPKFKRDETPAAFRTTSATLKGFATFRLKKKLPHHHSRDAWDAVAPHGPRRHVAELLQIPPWPIYLEGDSACSCYKKWANVKQF